MVISITVVLIVIIIKNYSDNHYWNIKILFMAFYGDHYNKINTTHFNYFMMIKWRF